MSARPIVRAILVSLNLRTRAAVVEALGRYARALLIAAEHLPANPLYELCAAWPIAPGRKVDIDAAERAAFAVLAAVSRGDPRTVAERIAHGEHEEVRDEALELVEILKGYGPPVRMEPVPR